MAPVWTYSFFFPLESSRPNHPRRSSSSYHAHSSIQDCHPFTQRVLCSTNVAYSVNRCDERTRQLFNAIGGAHTADDGEFCQPGVHGIHDPLHRSLSHQHARELSHAHMHIAMFPFPSVKMFFTPRRWRRHRHRAHPTRLPLRPDRLRLRPLQQSAPAGTAEAPCDRRIQTADPRCGRRRHRSSQ